MKEHKAILASTRRLHENETLVFSIPGIMRC